MSIEEYFGKDSRPLQDINDSLLEWDESLSNYGLISKIVIVDVKCVSDYCGLDGEEGNIDLVLILKTGELQFKNVEKSKSWVGNSANYISIATNKITRTEDIVGVRLEADGYIWHLTHLHVQVATVSGSHTPPIIGNDLNVPTDEFKTLKRLHTLINAKKHPIIDFWRCNTIFECVPTIPSAPIPPTHKYDTTLKAGNSVTIQWKKPKFDGFLDILRYEVWSRHKNVWIDAGLEKDSKKTFTYTINYDDNLPGHSWWCDTIKIRAVNAKGPGHELTYNLHDPPN